MGDLRGLAAAGCLLFLAGSAQAADKLLRIGVTNLPPSYASPFATAATPAITVTSAIYEGLTRIAMDGAVRPWLAVGWTNVDPRTWRFELRRDVRFTNGAAFDAAAVAGVVADLAAPGQPNENLRRELPRMTAARAVGPFTVEIVTAEPLSSFPRWASILLIHEPAALRKLGTEAYARAPVGTGPFAVQGWEANRLLLKAVPSSWRRPRLDRIEIDALPEATARLQALVSSRLDIAVALGPEDAQAIQAAGGRLATWSEGTVQGISLVATRKLPFNDVRVRQALNMAVDRDALVDVLLQRATVPASQPAGRSVFGYDPEIPPYPYDPARARALLAAAGHPDGFSFTLETAGVGAAALAVVQQVAADLKKIGVSMEIRLVPTPQFLKNVLQTGETADAFTFPWPSTPTLDVLRSLRVHSCLQPHAWYCDADATEAMAAAEAAFDQAKGLAMRQELGRRYHDQAPAIFLYEQASFAGLSRRVRGFEDAFGFVSYDKLDIKN